MKKWFMGLRVGIGICAAMGWWGVLYPELSLTPDTYKIIMEDGTIQESPEVVEWDFDSDIYQRLLSADRSQVRFKSKLLETVADWMAERKE